MYGLLHGVRVIDLTTVVLGPLATAILGDLGADVIKVESPDGDLFRATSPSQSPGMGAPYLGVNRNKRSIVLDLKQPDAAEVMERLVAGADVLVHNMRPRAVEKLGLTAERLRGINPRLIHCTAVGYGSDGPFADLPAYDDVLQGRAGLASLLADDAGNPRLAPTIIADKVTGLYVAQSVLAALFARERSGEGATIEVPMHEVLTSFVLAEHMGGRAFDPQGEPGYNRLLNPYRRPHRTADGHIVVLPYSTRHWRSVFELAGRHDWLEEDWVSDPEQRTRRVDELYRFLGEITPDRTTAEWIEAFASIDVPCSPVNSLSDLFADPHLTAVGMFETDDHPTEGSVTLPRHPVSYDQSTSADRPVARLGEHSDEILRELGYSSSEIEDLSAAGVLGTR